MRYSDNDENVLILGVERADIKHTGVFFLEDNGHNVVTWLQHEYKPGARERDVYQCVSSSTLAGHQLGGGAASPREAGSDILGRDRSMFLFRFDQLYKRSNQKKKHTYMSSDQHTFCIQTPGKAIEPFEANARCNVIQKLRKCFAAMFCCMCSHVTGFGKSAMDTVVVHLLLRALTRSTVEDPDFVVLRHVDL